MTGTTRPSRKPIRLPAGAYAVPGSAWLVTIGAADRAHVFADHALARAVTALLEERCPAMGATLDAYCLMPDHAHLLLQITTGNLIDVVRDAKSRTTHLWWNHDGSGPLWQRSFHDRGLRTPAHYDLACAYILENPVRAGLVAAWSDYPFLGGAYLSPPLAHPTHDPPTAPSTQSAVGEGPVPSPSPTPSPAPDGHHPSPTAPSGSAAPREGTGPSPTMPKTAVPHDDPPRPFDGGTTHP